MRDDIKEQLSALADDEVRPEELGLLVRRLGNDPEMAQQVGRYYLIRDVLHRDVPAADASDFSARVAAAIDLETKPLTQPVTWARRATRPLTGLAIAASVAFSVVMVWPRSEVATTPPPVAQTASAGSTATGNAAIQFAAGRDGLSLVDMQAPLVRPWEQLDPRLQQKLNGLLVNHSEYSASGRLGSVLPYSRIAGHDEAAD
jgi:anti-sigma factor RsiW